MLQVLKVVENWRMRRGGRSRNYHVQVVYEDKSLRDLIEEAIENMPPDLKTWSKGVNRNIVRVVVRRTA